ncbi:MAG: DUF192 domain-containing protein [Actinobacteria bacterium]|nr:DUF192 domain-containing protein [Actinomycetota bacterium]
MRKVAVLAVLIAALAGTLVSIAPSASVTRTRLALDGVPFKPELALTSAARSRGLMNRRPAPADGMLFVFRTPTSGGFWMKNTLVPLTIGFFNRDGERVRRLSMVPCRADPCRIYEPGKLYRFALELRASDRRAARRLGPVTQLRRLIQAAE